MILEVHTPDNKLFYCVPNRFTLDELEQMLKEGYKVYIVRENPRERIELV